MSDPKIIPAHDPPEEDEDEIECEPPLRYPDWCEPDEQRRAWVLECLGSGEIDGKVLAENCALLTEWVKTGNLPPPPRKPKAV